MQTTVDWALLELLERLGTVERKLAAAKTHARVTRRASANRTVKVLAAEARQVRALIDRRAAVVAGR